MTCRAQAPWPAIGLEVLAEAYWFASRRLRDSKAPGDWAGAVETLQAIADQTSYPTLARAAKRTLCSDTEPSETHGGAA